MTLRSATTFKVPSDTKRKPPLREANQRSPSPKQRESHGATQAVEIHRGHASEPAVQEENFTSLHHSLGPTPMSILLGPERALPRERKRQISSHSLSTKKPFAHEAKLEVVQFMGPPSKHAKGAGRDAHSSCRSSFMLDRGSLPGARRPSSTGTASLFVTHSGILSQRSASVLLCGQHTSTSGLACSRPWKATFSSLNH